MSEEVKEVKEEIIFKLFDVKYIYANNNYEEFRKIIQQIMVIDKIRFPDAISFEVGYDYLEVIFNGDEIIGYLLACNYDPHYQKENVVYVLTLNIKDEYQKRGYGSQLLNNLLNYFKIPVILDSENHLIEFYEKNGFKEFSRLKHSTHPQVRFIKTN